MGNCVQESIMKIVAIITARIKSERLQGKALMNIRGKPMLWHVVNRVKASMVDEVVVATTKKDKEIKAFCADNNISLYAGSEEDILERLYHASRRAEADIVVRVWGDCPLIDPVIIDETIRCYLNEDFMYVTNAGYPTGLNVAVISFGALKKAHRAMKDPEERHWIHKYFIENLDSHKIGVWNYTPDLSYLQWSVDYQKDMDFVRGVYNKFFPRTIFGMKEILK